MGSTRLACAARAASHLWLCLMVAGVLACGGAPPPALRGAPAEWQGPLEALVPEDASVLVVMRPVDILADPALRAFVASFLSEERLERYRVHTGIDLRALTSAVWADTPRGSMWLVRGPFGAPLAVEEMGVQMLPLEARTDEPFTRRVGHYRGARRDLVAIDGRTLLASTGEPQLIGDVLAAVAASRPSNEPAVGAAGEPTPSREALLASHPAAFQLLVPRPLGLPPETSVGRLMLGERSLVATLRSSVSGDLEVEVDLRGSFPPGVEDHIRRLVGALAASDVGAAFGLSDALLSLDVSAGEGFVRLRLAVPLRRAVIGCRMLFDAEIADLSSLGEVDGETDPVAP